jgi:uncharacterized protein YkwD
MAVTRRSNSTRNRLHAPSTPRGRRVLSSLAVVIAVVMTTGLLTACETTEADRLAVIDQVNASRAANGLPALAENTTLDQKADAWAARLRDECNIFHSKLSDGAPPEWRKLGENVGRGGSIEQVHTAYLNSPGHRANILDGSFTEMGAGAVWGECNGYRTVFTVHVFMRT